MAGSSETPVVVLVDDESALLDLYETVLSGPFEVRTASGGTQALERVDGSVDAVVLDRRMPEMSGDEVLAAIRERGEDVPVAMLSAVAPDGDIVELSIDDYLVKPFDTGDLRETVRGLVSRRDLDRPCREFVRLAAKRASLESAGASDSGRSTAVGELDARMDALRETVATGPDQPTEEPPTDPGEWAAADLVDRCLERERPT